MKTTSALMVEWGMPIPGRETKALEVFANHVAWWTQLKSNGKLADFHVYGELTGNLTRRVGLAILEGTEDQVRALHASEEFRSYTNRAAICVDRVNVTLLESGDAMTTRMQRYGKNLKEVVG